MLKVIPYFIACVSLALCTASEGLPWKPEKLTTDAAGKTLRGIFFLDEKKGWIVGDGGLCLSTANSGLTWEKVATDSDATLRGVRFNDALHGFICGDGDSAAPKATGHVVMMQRPLKSGSLLTTEDGGKTWKKNWVPCNFEIWCVEASGAPALQVGVGCEEHLDGDITRSNDGGATWQERRVFRALSDIRAVDANRWIAVGSPVSVGFSGAINDPAYVAKECRALFSKDGGKTWTPSKGSDGSTCLRGLLARKGLPAFAVGDGGALLRSEDNGETWKAITSPEPLGLRSLAASGDTATVAVGAFGRFIVSKDAGKTWRASWIGQMQQLYAVAACGGKFWCVGANGCVASCEAKALAEAKDLPAAPEPPKVEEKPLKKSTAAQRARIKVGDFVVYAMKMQAPALGMNSECQIKMTVTAINGEEFTLTTEVLKGTPPPGMPQKSEEKGRIADLTEFSGYEIGKSKEEKDGPMTLTLLREQDEAITVMGKNLTCLVLKSSGDLPNGSGHVAVKQWFCEAEVPFLGLVKLESDQTMALPTGATAKLTRTQELKDWARGK